MLEARLREQENAGPESYTGVDTTTNADDDAARARAVWGSVSGDDGGVLEPVAHPVPFNTSVDYSNFDVRTGRAERMVRRVREVSLFVSACAA